MKVWYTNGRRKNSTRGEPFSRLTVRVTSILLGFAVGDFGLTTPLTIYGFGLRGNSAYKSIRKHRFRTKKHQKVNKSSQKTMAYLFGNWRPRVRVPPLRPKQKGAYELNVIKLRKEPSSEMDLALFLQKS